MIVTAPLIERFWARVPNGLDAQTCWLWPGISLDSYGTIGIGAGKVWRAHRLSWVIHNGPIEPDSLRVCHACDMPPCVNPSHLWLGTDKDNRRDFTAKGWPAIRKHVFWMWLQVPKKERRSLSPRVWAIDTPSVLEEAKRRARVGHAGPRFYDGKPTIEVRDGVRYYEIWGEDPIGEPEDPARCIGITTCQGDALGLYSQCGRPRQTNDGYCWQHALLTSGQRDRRPRKPVKENA